MPAAAASTQTFGDFLGFNTHLHILAADGGFGASGMFYADSTPSQKSCPLFWQFIIFTHYADLASIV